MGQVYGFQGKKQSKSGLKKDKSPEKKKWSEMTGHDISVLMQKGWNSEKIREHYKVSQMTLYKKIRFDWHFDVSKLSKSYAQKSAPKIELYE